MKRIRDWFFTIPALIGIGGTLVLFEILGRLSLLRGLSSFERTMTTLQRVLLKAFGIAGTSISVKGADNLEPDAGYILISNHQSLLDIPILGGLLSSNIPKFIAKQELARRIPSVSLYLNKGGNGVIDRRDRDQALDIIAEVGREAQRRRVSVVIFPEGTRSRDGTLGAFRSAGAKALLEAAPNLPIIPTAIDGSWRVMENNFLPIPYGTKVRVRFGEPIARHVGEDPAKVIAECRNWIEGTLEEWRVSPLAGEGA